MSAQQPPDDGHGTDDRTAANTASSQSLMHRLRHIVTGGGTGLLAGGCTLGGLMALIGGVTGLVIGGVQGGEAFYADFVQPSVEAGQGSGIFLLIWIPFFLIYVVIGGVLGMVSGVFVGLVSGLVLGALVGLLTGSGVGFGMNKIAGGDGGLQSWQSIVTIVVSVLVSIALSFLIITFFTSGVEDVFDGTAINDPAEHTPTVATAATATATLAPLQASAIANLTAQPRRTPRPTLTPLPDFATYADPNGVFRIGVPAAWQAVPATATNPPNASAQFTTDDPLRRVWVFALPQDAPLSEEAQAAQLEQTMREVHATFTGYADPNFQSFPSRVDDWTERQVFTAVPDTAQREPNEETAFLRGEGYARADADHLHIVIFTSTFTDTQDRLIQTIVAGYQP